LIALSGILKEGILLLVRSDGTHTNYRGREGREHPEYYLKNSMSSPDTMRTPKKSRNLSFTQYNTQYEEQEKKKQRRGEDTPTNNSGLRSRQNSNNNNGNNSINNSNIDGNISGFDRKTSISRGNSNISTMNHGNSNVSCENNGFHEDSQSNISTMHRNTNSSRFKSDENDRTRIASSNGNGSGSGGISYCDPDGGEEGSHGDRDREGEEGGVEMWAMSLIGESTRYYTVRYCTVLCCTVLHCDSLCCTVYWTALLYSTVLSK
jgi:hypothetical protein